jgi:hypothetical protein
MGNNIKDIEGTEIGKLYQWAPVMTFKRERNLKSPKSKEP